MCACYALWHWAAHICFSFFFFGFSLGAYVDGGGVTFFVSAYFESSFFLLLLCICVSKLCCLPTCKGISTLAHKSQRERAKNNNNSNGTYDERRRK